MKGLIILLIGIFLSIQAFSQNKPSYHQAPLNPEFISYLESRSKGDLKTDTAEKFRSGYVPGPLYLHFKNNTCSGNRLKSTVEFPARYDLRELGLVTPVKNQGTSIHGGNCAIFTSIGALESRWLVAGDDEFDLSEQHMAACLGFEWAYGEGAHFITAAAYLSRLSGPVLESDNPYDPFNHTCLELDPIKLVPEIRLLNNNRDVIKKAIMDYGAVCASVHIDYDAFDYTFNTYYYYGSESPNHAWLIVGWDDNIITPGGLGTWIIKNSWSDEWAEEGYIYCSYNDNKNLTSTAQFQTRWEPDEVDTLYMYDKLGATGSTGYLSPIGYGLVRFEAPKEQLVTKIGTYMNSEGSILDIEIFDDFDGIELSNLLNSKKNIYVEFPGYYTFDIPTHINGDFYIKVKYNTPGYSFPVPTEVCIKNYANPFIESDVNWISSDAKDWKSSNRDPENDTSGHNLTIRAYAVDIGSPRALFEANKEIVCLNSIVTYTFLDNGTPSSYSWDFGVGASPATADSKGPHQVTYLSEGRKTVSLSVDGNEPTTRHQYIDVSSKIKVEIPQDSVIGPVGQEYEITAFGADTYSWTPSDFLNTDVGATVKFDPDEAGIYDIFVEGTQGTCTDRDTLIFVLKLPPPNDNVCDAIELDLLPTVIDSVTNRNATVEFNEPNPPYGEGKCFDKGWWCNEGGLQNSIWYWFIATKDTVLFDGKGMDNQIAIYQAETCEDILDNKYTLIDAVDDCRDRPDNSFLIKTRVEKGKKYFVQIDGSEGGQEGTFSLVYFRYPVGIDKMSTDNYLHIYPNPSDGSFNIKLKSTDPSPVHIQVYNLSGQLIYERSYEQTGDNAEIKLDISDQAMGIYQVRMVQENWVLNQKIILQ